ncbi:unannotated protein [freshwater metagenome]|uniref:Unannotated protein n=1 Tax=freshwater metagenome TaxID=449393 RepID=A0A6J5YE68_9ZZZZ
MSIKQLIKIRAGTAPGSHLGSHLEGSGDRCSSGGRFDLPVEHRLRKRTFELGTCPRAMQMVNGADSVVNRRAWKFDYWWLSDSDQLDPHGP